jgi:cell division protein FtsL
MFQVLFIIIIIIAIIISIALIISCHTAVSLSPDITDENNQVCCKQEDSELPEVAYSQKEIEKRPAWVVY